MQIKGLLLMAVLFCALNSFGQNNFKFSPEKNKKTWKLEYDEIPVRR
jgi:hypothetical protein